jgi:3-oxoacyl-[acyl-carrier protein] reductase
MLKNKIAIVTGGTGAIGKSVAQQLSQEGAKVYISYLKNHEEAKTIEEQNKNIKSFKMDLDSLKYVNREIGSIISRESRIDILVNNAAPQLILKPFEKMNNEDFERDCNVILKGAVMVCKSVVSAMKKQRSGKIINMLTTAVIGKAPSRMTSYIIAKYGLLGLTKALATELTPFNVQVNAVSPYFIESNMTGNVPSKMLEMIKENNPMKRLCTPEDISSVVSFLCSERSNYISGVNIPVSGGDIVI